MRIIGVCCLAEPVSSKAARKKGWPYFSFAFSRARLSASCLFVVFRALQNSVIRYDVAMSSTFQRLATTVLLPAYGKLRVRPTASPPFAANSLSVIANRNIRRKIITFLLKKCFCSKHKTILTLIRHNIRIRLNMRWF